MLDGWPRLAKKLGAFLSDQSGTTAIEYAIIASVISIAILASAMSVGTALNDNFYEKAAKAFE